MSDEIKLFAHPMASACMRRWLPSSWRNRSYFSLPCVACFWDRWRTGYTVLGHSAVRHVSGLVHHVFVLGSALSFSPSESSDPDPAWLPLFSVILESWMGTLYRLWIKHPSFSPENPAGQASPFDHGMSVLILFPEPPSEAMQERWFSHTGLSLKEQIHPLCEGPGPLHTQLRAWDLVSFYIGGVTFSPIFWDPELFLFPDMCVHTVHKITQFPLPGLQKWTWEGSCPRAWDMGHEQLTDCEDSTERKGG